MALKGNLAVFTTTQLLNLINLSKRTGVLHVYEGKETGRKLTLGDGETQIPELALVRCNDVLPGASAGH